MSNDELTQYQKDLIKALETTTEYKAWQESLFAIIGYVNSKDPENKDLVRELMTDHLISSFELLDGLEIAKFKTSKNMHDETMMDYSGQ